MGAIIRKTIPLAQQFADFALAIKKQVGAGAAFHLDASEATIGSANASDLATSLTLVNEIAALFYGLAAAPGSYPGHANDALAHKVADTTNTRAAAYPATDLATAITLANEIKADYEAHRASTTFHYTADATNTIAAANATDQSSLNTLANELKTDINAHMASAPTNNASIPRLAAG